METKEIYAVRSGDVDLSFLAAQMLQWERLRYQLDELEAEIKTAVLKLGRTQTVGNVRATYSNGRKTYDYRSAAETALDSGLPAATVAFAAHEKTTYDYLAICKELDLTDLPFTQGQPSVSIKTLS